MHQKVIVLGAGGQLGQELVRACGSTVECVGLTRSELDIGDAIAVSAVLGQIAPAVVINAAAYTAVDKAEAEPERAHQGNVDGAANVARACAELGAQLIHISTDYVFSGESSMPYAPDSATAPIGEYGRSKLAGEVAVTAILPSSVIVRSGWIYSSYGGNFVKTMLRLMSQRSELNVVADQVGTPTWAKGFAEAIWACSQAEQVDGIYHWSDAGVCSWYDFAVAIYEEALALELLSAPIKINPIAGADYPTPARRPAYSVLDKSRSWRDFGVDGVHWRVQLRSMLLDLKERENE